MKHTFFTLIVFFGVSTAQALEHPPGRLGVATHEVSSEDVVNMGLPGEYGARVEAVEAGGPAAVAGLKVNDVILAFNAHRVDSARALRRMVYENPAGREVELRVYRNNRPALITVKLGEGEDIPRHGAGGGREPRSFGAWIEPVQPQLGEYLGLEEDQGLMVMEVQEGSAADRAGIRAKDVLVKIAGEPLTDPETVGEVINAMPGNAVEVVLIRNGLGETVTVRF